VALGFPKNLLRILSLHSYILQVDEKIGSLLVNNGVSILEIELGN
jgi:hypothetical protein